MIAHHEGAVDMAKVFLATPKKDQDPQVTAWADDVSKVQEKEIAEMKELLKPLGGIEESAYAPMKKAMQHMLEEGKNLGANHAFCGAHAAAPRDGAGNVRPRPSRLQQSSDPQPR